MKEDILKIKKESLNLIEKAKSLDDLEKVRIDVLGKKGSLSIIMKQMGKLSKEERPLIGKLANEVRSDIEESLKNKKDILEKELLKERVKKEAIDVTAQRKLKSISHRHPLNQTMEELENLFQNMGFDVVDGPEIESVKNTFDLLNSPKSHPSRSKSDTFYLDDDTVLRPHTSSVQIRVMQSSKPPIRMVSAGRTFRFDEVDDTH